MSAMVVYPPNMCTATLLNTIYNALSVPIPSVGRPKDTDIWRTSILYKRYFLVVRT